jgi:hypothetical protein
MLGKRFVSIARLARIVRSVVTFLKEAPMLPPRPQHEFVVNSHRFVAVRYTRGGERRIRQQHALSLSLLGVMPDVLAALDGDNLYQEALLHEVLTEAPRHWWEEAPATPGTNGTPKRVLSFEQVDPDEFRAVAVEVTHFLTSFRADQPASAPPAGPTDASGLADAQAVPAPFRGIAS